MVDTDRQRREPARADGRDDASRRDGADRRGQEEDGGDGRSSADRVISMLRFAALGLLVVGFSGWAIEDGEIGLESPFTIAFAAGVACALVSIYLGVFLANADE